MYGCPGRMKMKDAKIMRFFGVVIARCSLRWTVMNVGVSDDEKLSL
jgi:hypothetical protein